MPAWLWFVGALGGIIVLCLVLMSSLVVRRRMLTRGGAGFEMSVNESLQASVHGWMLGVAVYGRSEVDWYRTFSLSWRPRYRFPRGGVLVGERRSPAGAEMYALHDGHVVVGVNGPGGVSQVAMSPMALTGFLAWLESSPPGDGASARIATPEH